MTRYAAETQVPVERTRVEIEKTLQRYGATSFISGYDEARAMIGFTMRDRQVKFVLPLPRRDDRQFTMMRRGSTRRSPSAANAAWEKACRQRWRALALIIKAKLEAVSSGIVTFETEFLPHIVLPDGRTVAEHVVPQLAIAYGQGTMPPLLPYYGEGGKA